MKLIRFVFLLLFYIQSSQAQTIEEELRSKEASSISNAQKAKIEEDRKQANSDQIKKTAFIVSCNPNWEGIYAFLNGRIYVYTSSFDKSKFNLENAYFDISLPYSVSGNVVSWRSKEKPSPFMTGERWEYHLDTNVIYRKTLMDSIYQDVCKVLQSPKQ